MPKLLYEMDKEKAKWTAGTVTLVSEDDKGHIRVEELSPSYLVFFDYESVSGCLMLHRDHAMIQLLNDYSPRDKDPGCADSENLNAFIRHMEFNGLTDGAELARFLRDSYGDLFGGDYLSGMERGIRFSAAYPLWILTPEADFKKLLLERGNAYTWRREVWYIVDDLIKIDIATFAPASESDKTQ